MPPQRRKYNLESLDEEKPSNKRVKNMHSSFYSRRSSKSSSNEYTESGGFSQKRCTLLFNEYVSPDDPEVIGPEGIERFCCAISVEPEDVVMLVIAWKMDAKQMGYFTLKEWLKGLSDVQCDSVAKIRSRIDSLRSMLNEPVTFKSIYRYAFDFAKDKDQRSMDMETARAMLTLLLQNRWELYPFFHRFLEQSKYKVINKDQWFNVLEFSRSVALDLHNYDEDGAWPVLLDEFVDWYRKNVLSADDDVQIID